MAVNVTEVFPCCPSHKTTSSEAITCDCINWIDINDLEISMKLSGKSHRELIRRLHVIKDNEIYSGVRAFIIMWRNIPKYRWIGNIVAMPVIYHIGVILYEIIALFLFYKNRHQLNEKN